jgi:predicted membrane-bound spermidine synthase
LFATRIGAFFGLDVVVSAIALFVFIATEGRRLAMLLLWLSIIATLLVGVSLGLPLFLYFRQRQLDVASGL